MGQHEEVRATTSLAEAEKFAGVANRSAGNLRGRGKKNGTFYKS